MIDHSFGFYGIAFFGIILLRYFVMAGATYWVLYKPLHSSSKESLMNLEQKPLLNWQSIQYDIHLSVVSAVVFAIASAVIMTAYSMGLTRLYSNPQQYGLWYLGISYLGVLILQDTYFYFTHRLFHHPSLFRWTHQGHHRSRYPTPWTSFAFDPLEAIVQAIFLMAITLVIPLHFITLIAILTTMTIWAIVNHLASDRLPPTFPHHWLSKWFIGPAHHSIHHLKYTKHYGLYFTFWDKFLNTEDANYINKSHN